MNNNLHKISLILNYISIYFLILLPNKINANQLYMKREHSLVNPYQGTAMSLPYWDYAGTAMITSNYVRLTPDSQSKDGSIWNHVPIMSNNWEIHTSFKVHGKGKDLFGDGFAIWYTKHRMEIGSVFGSRDYFSGLAVILDTYSNHNGIHNHQHPYISAMVNNGSLSYDHDSDGTHTQLAGCEAKFRNVNYNTLISVRYENDVLTVSTDVENKGEWKQCFTVNDVQLPTGYYLGVSANTGDLSDFHDVISIKFYDLDPVHDSKKSAERLTIIPQASTFSPPRERKNDIKPTMSNARIFMLIIFGMIITLIVTLGGIWYYQNYKEKARKLW